MLGVLGGMGPLATVDFLMKVIQQTDGSTDQRHIPTVVWSVPQVPDRSTHIINGGESPYPQLQRGIKQLQSMGASVVAIPCNTAHFWYQQLVDSTGITILHIAEAVFDQLNHLFLDLKTTKKVGLLGTSGLVQSNIYQDFLKRKGWEVITPNLTHQLKVMEGIQLVKAGKLVRAKTIFSTEIELLKAQGASAIILGCTELPLVVDASDYVIDSNLALAKRCVKWFEASYHGTYFDSTSDNIHLSSCAH